MSSRTTRALLTGKIGNRVIDIIDKKRGTNWAGRQAMKIDPELISHITGIDPAKVLFITGTNGKSSVTNMVTHILRSRGFKVVSNVEGANLITGVAAALVKEASLDGRINADYCVFETDERYLYKIREQLSCDNLLVTNLEKDQVQRNGDPDFVYRKIARVVDRFGMKLFLNGDEPRSCSLADRTDRAVFYSVDKHDASFTKDDTFVTMPCPKCHRSIRFDYYNNDGMGSFRCENCGYTNHNGADSADYTATDADFTARKFCVNGTEFPMPYDQPYMLYNYAAAACACKELAGVTEEESAAALADFVLLEGRIETLEYKGNHIKYIRFKQENPETLQNFINVVAADPEEKTVVIGIGTVEDYDPYYINSFYTFDCDFSRLKDANVRKFIFTTDTIAYDAANSFIYGGADPGKIEILPVSDEEKILEAIAAEGCSNVYLTIKLHTFEGMKEFARKEK